VPKPKRQDEYEKLIEELRRDKEKCIVDEDTFFAVYLLADCRIDWLVNAGRTIVDYGKLSRITAYISRLEYVAAHTVNKRSRITFGGRFGCVLSHFLRSNNLELSLKILEEIEQELGVRYRERLKAAMLVTSIGVAAALAVFGIVAWALRETIAEYLGTSGLEVLLAAIAGGIGSTVSVVARVKTLHIQPEVPMSAHILESLARSMIGGIGGFIAALAVKGNLVVGFIASSNRLLPVLLTVCLAAGVSERLVPSLVKQIESSFRE
jgi:hypothetical protein